MMMFYNILFVDNEEEEDGGTPYEDLIDDKTVKISLITSTSNHFTATRIIESITNTYLINNYGAVVNFSIIKDIIDRDRS